MWNRTNHRIIGDDSIIYYSIFPHNIIANENCYNGPRSAAVLTVLPNFCNYWGYLIVFLSSKYLCVFYWIVCNILYDTHSINFLIWWSAVFRRSALQYLQFIRSHGYIATYSACTFVQYKINIGNIYKL